MNYRHIYHAGNFADVFKHILLTAITQSFLKKESPFCYLDTHAGTGKYDLSAKAAQINKEFLGGIGKLRSGINPPSLIKTYLSCVQKMNPSSDLRFYPGSPSFVKNFLRPQDKMVLCELHPEDYQSLKKCFQHDQKVFVHKQDAYSSLKAFLPPNERRGFVLIDPPYEKADEIQLLLKSLPESIKRWPTGMFALWYPIKSRHKADIFVNKLTAKVDKPTLIAELSVFPEDMEQHLNGNGMFIVNPPWQLKQELEAVLPWVWENLSGKQGGYYLADSFAN